MPYDRNLGALLHEPSFQSRVPQVVFQKARVIQKVGNIAVHERGPIASKYARQVVIELHHVCYWLVRNYAPDASRDGAAWRDERIPQPLSHQEVVPRKELEALEQRLAEQNEEALERQQERDASMPSCRPCAISWPRSAPPPRRYRTPTTTPRPRPAAT